MESAIVRKAQWSINRLRLMSAGEVAARLQRAVTQQVEKSRVRRGWSPGAAAELKRTYPLFAGRSRDAIVQAWQETFPFEASAAADALDGRVTLFSKTYDIGRRPDWSRDPATGRVAPCRYGKTLNYREAEVVGNIKVLWEMGRQQYLVPLAVRYLITGDARYRETVVQHVDSWVTANPFAMGVHWCSAMEVALRAVSWIVVHSLLALRDGDEGLLAASGDGARLTEALFNHGHFIRHHLSRHSSANNHLAGELVGLWCVAQVFDFGETSRAWAAQARREIEREARLQVHPDGVAREQAVHYQIELLEYLLLAWCVGAATGAPLGAPVRQAIEGMYRFLSALRPAGGELPRIGDSDDGLVLRFDFRAPGDPGGDVTEAVEHVFSGGDVVRSEKAFWYGWLGAGTGAGEVDASVVDGAGQQPVRVFDHGGYVVFSDAGLHLVFDAGPLGYLSIAAHGHADALAICAAWNGQWWLVDPGTYTYQEDPPYRAYFRGTSAHNTATVAGEDQSLQTGPFMWRRHAGARLHGAGCSDGVLWAAGSHDGYRRLGVEHSRRIEASRGSAAFRVIDRFVTADPGADIELHYHFHPEVALELTGEHCLARRPDTPMVLSIVLDRRCDWTAVQGGEDPIRGWYSPAFGEKRPCWTLTGCMRIVGATEVVTDLAPGHGTAGPGPAV